MIFREWCHNNGYCPGLELDRADNNGDYTPENCRFVTHRENLLNTHRAKKYRGKDTYETTNTICDSSFTQDEEEQPADHKDEWENDDHPEQDVPGV